MNEVNELSLRQSGNDVESPVKMMTVEERRKGLTRGYDAEA